MLFRSGTYQAKSTGGGVRYGLPIGDDDYVNFGLSADATKLSVDSSSPVLWQQFVQQYGESYTTLVGSGGWAKETIDSRIYPTSGYVNRISGELGLPGGNLQYYKTSFQHQRYFPITRQYTLALNGELGIGNGLGGKPLP